MTTKSYYYQLQFFLDSKVITFIFITTFFIQFKHTFRTINVSLCMDKINQNLLNLWTMDH